MSSVWPCIGYADAKIANIRYEEIHAWPFVSEIPDDGYFRLYPEEVNPLGLNKEVIIVRKSRRSVSGLSFSVIPIEKVGEIRYNDFCQITATRDLDNSIAGTYVCSKKFADSAVALLNMYMEKYDGRPSFQFCGLKETISNGVINATTHRQDEEVVLQFSIEAWAFLDLLLSLGVLCSYPNRVTALAGITVGRYLGRSCVLGTPENLIMRQLNKISAASEGTRYYQPINEATLSVSQELLAIYKEKGELINEELLEAATGASKYAPDTFSERMDDVFSKLGEFTDRILLIAGLAGGAYLVTKVLPFFSLWRNHGKDKAVLSERHLSRNELLLPDSRV